MLETPVTQRILENASALAGGVAIAPELRTLFGGIAILGLRELFGWLRRREYGRSRQNRRRRPSSRITRTTNPRGRHKGKTLK